MYKNKYNEAVIEYIGNGDWNKQQKQVFKNLHKLKYSLGNTKIGDDTIIFNLGPAKQCPSDIMGLCEFGSINGNGLDYALKAERMYPQSMAFRKIQSFQWQHWDPEFIATEFINILLSKPKIKYIRLNESGDFWEQNCINKLSIIANYIQLFFPKIMIYTYTHRKDLNFSNLPQNVTINGSGFMVHNNYKIVPDKAGKSMACRDNCRTCNLCKVRHGKEIFQTIH